MKNKTCPICGTAADVDDDRCARCDHRFGSVLPPAGVPTADSEAGRPPEKVDGPAAAPAPVIEARTRPASRRPDGGTPMSLGWLCFVLSIILLAISFAIRFEPWEVGAYADTYWTGRAAAKLYAIILLRVGAGALFSLFLILWSVGYIVRAISFLPGKQD